MSRPEETLEQLARVARADEQLHAALERRGTARAMPEDEPRLRSLPSSLSVSSPLSEDRQQQLVEQIRARMGGAPARTALLTRRVIVSAAGVGAMAAALSIWLSAPRVFAPLPGYQLRVQGAQQGERAAAPETGALRLRPGSRLHLALRPEADVTGDVRARLFVRAMGERALGAELLLKQEQSSTGSLRVEAEVPSSLPEGGELVLLVGRPPLVAKLAPDGDETVLRRLPASDVQAFRRPFERAP